MVFQGCRQTAWNPGAGEAVVSFVVQPDRLEILITLPVDRGEESVGWKDEESRALLNRLMDEVETVSGKMAIRMVKYRPDRRAAGV